MSIWTPSRNFKVRLSTEIYRPEKRVMAASVEQLHQNLQCSMQLIIFSFLHLLNFLSLLCSSDYFRVISRNFLSWSSVVLEKKFRSPQFLGVVEISLRNHHVICTFLISSSLFQIQLFRQRLSHKSVKAYATMPIGIMGRKSLALIDWGSRRLPTRKEKA